MLAALDPTMLHPPAREHSLDWVARTRQLADLAADAPVTFSCPQDLQDDAIARWYSPGAIQALTGGVLEHHDLVRVVEELRGRAIPDILALSCNVLVDDVTLMPDYQAPSLDATQQAIFREHLGALAFGKASRGHTAGTVTRSDSWSEVSEAIRVEGVVMTQTTSGEDEAIEDTDLREHLLRWCSARDVLRALADFPCSLMPHLETGVQALWVKDFDGDPSILSFRIGPNFRSSIQDLNYPADKRYAAACLRVMAQIAGGRAHEVEGHPERSGSGGNNPVLQTTSGFAVQRSYLAKKSPNAHRLFWVREDVPVFLNVGGHNTGPYL